MKSIYKSAYAFLVCSTAILIPAASAREIIPPSERHVTQSTIPSDEPILKIDSRNLVFTYKSTTLTYEKKTNHNSPWSGELISILSIKVTDAAKDLSYDCALTTNWPLASLTEDDSSGPHLTKAHKYGVIFEATKTQGEVTKDTFDVFLNDSIDLQHNLIESLMNDGQKAPEKPETGFSDARSQLLLFFLKTKDEKLKALLKEKVEALKSACAAVPMPYSPALVSSPPLGSAQP